MLLLIPSIRLHASEFLGLRDGLAVAGGMAVVGKTTVAWRDNFYLCLFISTATEIGSGSNYAAPAFSLW